jgi:Transposase DDE domain
MQAQHCAYEVLDSTAAVTRDAKRRGLGWLAGQADIGWSNRIGWYEGFHLLLCVNPIGVITGFGFGSASTHDQHLAATLFAVRQHPSPRLSSAGLPAQGSYVADKGFAGERPRRRWRQERQVDLVTPPHQTSKRIRWPKALRRWLASIRQIIETVNDKLLNTFRLGRERPHDLTGFQARLAAKVSLHNFCIWFNLHLGRAPLAFAELLAW